MRAVPEPSAIYMYKLLNKLFGWDYIYWSNCADRGVARVRKDGLDNPYYVRYYGITLYDKITSANQVMWLTCLPEKYLKIQRS